MTEEDIMHERGEYWVCRTTKNWFGKPERTYSVYKNGITHSTPVASFEQDEDGLSLSIAYCDYLDDRDSAKTLGMSYKEYSREVNIGAFMHE